ncbi:SDR family oxidoreductase [Saccharothrix violaceirubra]|uniref:NAD(P)-dependent dehydrogenase (Short-subunit alcohol dehydrogenase family) n=1 Tax=Saccharothrix violaceirubra TaxID=413306 RepID=A0A7W7T742_9PSEU|nr:SDR family NAD(P)-dependent oxidoreductase [Saccharothrix violaceirubra]MBB4967808.1 NAD(P)-dependent dehydrogenase (short-subunit alcohol dehydrogenase family) [Saccharothrix violaceirubra]
MTTRVALVTGSNRGIGLAIVRGLAEQGVHTALVARTEGAAARAAEPLRAEGLPVSAHQLDVTDVATIGRAVSDIVFEYGRLDILVNNAAVAIDRGFAASSLDQERVRATFEVNVFGAWRCVSAVVPVMKEQRYGRIVNLTTHMASLSTMKGNSPAYRVSKTAVNAMTKVLADELHEDGILVNAASPGQANTRMSYGAASQTPDEAARDLLWLATLPSDGPTGGLFHGRERLPW